MLGLLLSLCGLALTACGGPRATASPTATLVGPTVVATAAAATLAQLPKTATPITQLLPDGGQKPTLPPTPTQAPTPAPLLTLPPLAPIGIVLETANLRAGPGTNFEVIGEVEPGQEVRIRAQTADGDWLRLESEDEEVWIAALLVDIPAGLELPTQADVPTPSPTPAAGDVVLISDASITLPTYPWQQFTAPAYDAAAHWEYQQFDRSAYLASNPQPSSQTYRLVGLENRWLQLTLMPELGGRIYQMIFKPSGNNEVYQNPVIKPSPWGPGPDGNGWLAVGGIEWGLPVVEHGYAWGEVWGFITEPNPPAGAITVFTQDQDRLQLNVRVGLLPDSAAFSLDFDLENLGQQPATVSYWTNAMLAPGPANEPGPELRFLFPGNRISVHSTGDDDLPPPGQVMTWPEYDGRDLSRLGNWNRWLGFFAHPEASASWSAVYDGQADEGVVRVFSPQQTPGLKGFGFGWADPIPPSAYTDDGSGYVEMHGGLTSNFDQNLTFPPGEMRSWREVWYPAAGIGGVTAADANGAVNLTMTDGGLRLRLFSVSSRAGELVVRDKGGEVLHTALALDPAHPADLLLAAAQGPISFRFQASHGTDWQMAGLTPDQPNVIAGLYLPRLRQFGAERRHALYFPIAIVAGA